MKTRKLRWISWIVLTECRRDMGWRNRKSCRTRICFAPDRGKSCLIQSDARSLVEIIREYYEERKTRPAPSLEKQYYAGQANPVEKWSVGESTGVPPGATQISWERMDRSASR